MTLPARLRLWPTAEELARMARHPAAYAPTADEVLAPPPVPPPTIPMSADERRLMDAIIADPDADEPRLKYAEWVERSDPERAKFIRHQLLSVGRQAHESPSVGRQAHETPSVGRRAHETQGADAPRSEWADPFLPFGARDVVFRRGFAEAMSLTGRAFISLSDGLFAATPLREVRLIAVNFLLPELVACPNLRKLTRLDLQGNDIDDAGKALLAACEWLRGMEVLV